MPLNLNVVNVNIQFNKDGRPSGDADVDFATHEEAVEAMKKHKATMRMFLAVLYIIFIA
jgi:RNA recognition motif-containing protein